MTIYRSPPYLDQIAHGWKSYMGFPYVEDDRGQYASPYGYPGVEDMSLIPAIREALGKPLFIRHAVLYQGPGIAHPTRMMPLKDPWTATTRAELRHAHTRSVVAHQEPSTTDSLSHFKREYLVCMKRKCAAAKHMALVDNLESLAGHQQVVLITTPGASSIFLLDPQDGLAHYHLSYKQVGAHNLAMAAIMGTAAEVMCARGMTRIHLGGGMSKDPADPLMSFKARWGRDEHTVYFQTIP